MRMVVTLVVDTDTPNTVNNSVLKATKLLTVCELHVAEVDMDFEGDDEAGYEEIEQSQFVDVTPMNTSTKRARLVKIQD